VDQLLSTKLNIPRALSELVPRPRLIKRLNEGLHRKLTLISAPAGFGKTALVSQWLGNLDFDGGDKRGYGYRTAWLSLDESDNDLARFLAYLIAVLNQSTGNEVALGKGVLGLLQSPHPPQAEAVLTPLINELAAIPKRIILVLDDYHSIDSPPVNDALTFLLKHQPEQMHLVLTTRDDPQLSLARLRARGQLTELRATDLRFSTVEAAEFLNRVMGLDLSPEDIAALENRTEGWIAGLQLAAISMQGHKDSSSIIQSFTGSHRFILDYLIEEVLEQQSEGVQTFLLQTAILNRLNGSLCDFLIGQGNGQSTLEKLERANLFIVALDQERHWYRYHRLFADLLRKRQLQIWPDQVPVLHCKASEWYEQNGFVDEAIEHALCGEDFKRAGNLIEQHFDEMYQRGEHTKLRRWLAGLPVEWMFSKPQLCLLYAWNLFTSGQQDAAERSLQAVENMLDPSLVRADDTLLIEQPQMSNADRMKLCGRAAAMRAFLASYRADVPGTIQYASQALAQLSEQDLTWRGTAAIALGDAYGIKGQMAAAYQARLEALAISKATGDLYLSLIANLKLTDTLRMQGQLQRVIEICQQQLRLANESGLSHTIMAAWLLAIWGETLAELNDLDEALQQAKKGTQLSECGKDMMVLSSSCLCLVRVLFSSGDVVGAEQIIQKMEDIARKTHIPPWITNPMAAWKARIWLVQDKLEAASRCLDERGLDTAGSPTYLHEMEYMALARILIAQGRLEEATKLLQQLRKSADAGGRTSRLIEILILQALSLQARGDIDQALSILDQALIIAEPGGFIRVFVDEGPRMARLLYESLARGIAPDYIRRLLAAFPVDEPVQAGPTKHPADQSALVEPLSERELEVLQLIAEGLTNSEVASRLFLSLNTIKVHTSNIYSKLAVNNRTSAVARARALGILPPI